MRSLPVLGFPSAGTRLRQPAEACAPAAVSCLVLLCALAACRGGGKGGPAAIEVARAGGRWTEIEGEDGAVRDDAGRGAAMKKALRDGIARSGRFALVKAGGAGELVLEVTVMLPGREGEEQGEGGEARGKGGAAPLRTIFTLKYRDREGWPLSAAVSFDVPAGLDAPPPGRAGKAVDGLLASIARQVDLVRGDVAQARAALHDPDREMAVLAVQVLGERRDAASVEELCRMLDGTAAGDPMREPLIGALEKIGDPRATPHLVKAFFKAESWQEIQIVRAIAATGGPGAGDFLASVASGHELEPTRRIAADALAGMR